MWFAGGTEEERLFWAADFSASFRDARVLSQARILSGDMYPDVSALDDEWKAIITARQLLAEKEYDAADLVSSSLVVSTQPYIRVMAGYYRSWARWSKGELSDPVASIDTSTTFGRAMASQMLAWHKQRAFDFSGHLQELRTAVNEFLACDPIPVYWIAQTLVPMLHTAFEMADSETAEFGRCVFNSLEWTKNLEHQKFDCLRAISRFSFVTGDTDAAVKSIAQAKLCVVPFSCKAHAFLHSASYGLELNHPMWTREQLEIAEQLVSERTPCPELRTVILSLALQYSEVNAVKAQFYLAEYHRFQADKNLSVAYDRRLDAVANISIGKIGLAINPSDSYSLEILERSYNVMLEYGFRYRASIAASEIAGAKKRRKSKELWMENALNQIKYYGLRSPLRQLLSRKMERVQLTQSELRIYDLAVAGKTNEEIAESLCLSSHRVANALSEIYRKHGVKGRSELLARLR